MNFRNYTELLLNTKKLLINKFGFKKNLFKFEEIRKEVSKTRTISLGIKMVALSLLFIIIFNLFYFAFINPLYAGHDANYESGLTSLTLGEYDEAVTDF